MMSEKVSIAESEFRFFENSYIDPHGRLFETRDGLYRGIYPEFSEQFRRLLEAKSFKRLVKQQKIVKSFESSLTSDSFDLILEHQRLRYVTYCMEWPAEMLRDAGVLTLDVCLALLEDDWSLQDAHPWNIIFDGTAPNYIDVGSIRPLADEGSLLWKAYQQFCQFFLFPLYLYSKGFEEVARPQLYKFKDGVSYDLCSKVLPLKSKLWTPQILAHLELPLKASRLVKKTGQERGLRETEGRRIPEKDARRRFFSSLKADIERIKLPIVDSTWSDYYDEFPEFDNDARWNLKQKTVAQILDRVGPGEVLDVACNRGWYALLAAHRGSKVLAFDFDSSCVSQLYHEVKKHQLDVQPLVMDLLNPTPAFGWRNRQYPSAIQRLNANLVFAFAVIHHLVISQWQNFDRVVELLSDFTTQYLLVEFVPLEDDKVKEILRHSAIPSTDFYTLENFMKALSKVYKNLETFPSHPEGRTLILCELGSK
ncbi:MAG: class I SAM-dependent methyltransferase [Vulcanimicrobiota bacterium]